MANSFFLIGKTAEGEQAKWTICNWLIGAEGNKKLSRSYVIAKSLLLFLDKRQWAIELFARIKLIDKPEVILMISKSAVNIPAWCFSAINIFLFVFALAILMPRRADAQVSLATITTGASPAGIAVNPATNKVYVLNSGSSGTAGLAVIDANTGSTVSVNTGSFPQAVAINSVTNTIYVANRNSNSVTVVDGATDSVVTTITVGTGPNAIAVNPVTNVIYTANYTAGTVTVIDGASNTVTATVTVGTSPRAIAVNPVTNKTYVANSGSNNVSVINWANHALTISAGTGPQAIAINTNTDLIYVANSGSSNVSVIFDQGGMYGATYPVTTVSVGVGPDAIAVDPVTNRTYVTCINVNTVYWIDGANTATAITGVGTHPNGIAINSVTGIAYVTSRDSDVVIAIPEATNTVGTGIAVGAYPVAVATNPITNQLFVANNHSTTVTQLSGIQYSTPSISVGASPGAVVENPSTQTTYVINSGSGTVTPINEATGVAGTALTVGSNPTSAVVNPADSTVYVSNSGGSTVSQISGATVTSIAVGLNPGPIALNANTNKIYVANVGSGVSAGTLSVISGTSVTATLNVAVNPSAIGINPVTNMVYVANKGSNTLTIVNGSTDTLVTTDSVGTSPNDIAVNPVTNMTYVACSGSGTFSVFSGITNIGAVSSGATPTAVAVDPVRNLLYVLNSPATGSGSVYIYNGLPAGATTTAGLALLATVTVGDNPSALYVNPSTHQVYVANEGSSSVSVIDGVTFAATSFTVGTSPVSMAMSASKNVLYIVNHGANTVTAASGFQPVPLTTTISGVTDAYTLPSQNIFKTSNTSPSFTVQVYSNYTATRAYQSLTGAKNTPPTMVYYQIDSTSGIWQPAIVTSNAGYNPAVFTIPATSLSLGTHTLYAFAAYGHEGVSNSSGAYTGNSPEIGNIAAYIVSIVTAPSALAASSTALSSNSNPVTVGSTVTYTATVSGASGTPTGSVQFFDGATLLGTSTISSGVAVYSQLSIAAGFHSITATYTGDATYQTSSHNLLETTIGTSTPPTVSFSSAGTTQTVYDYSTMQCIAGDYPDAGTRAFRDAAGNVHLIATNSTNRQMVGTTLDTVTKQCPIIYQNDDSADPSQFDSQGWLESFYTLDGNTIYGYVSLDYHPYYHPTAPQCAGSPTNQSCWYSNIIQAKSTDGGQSFVSPPPGQARFVAGAAVPLNTSYTSTVGALIPTNIISVNGAYYMLLGVAAYTGTSNGECLLQTTNLDDPTSWRAWDGTGFNIQFVDPYTTSGIVVAQHECTPIDPTHLTAYARSLMVLMNGSTPAGYMVSMETSLGVVASTSSDLIHWSAPTVVVSGFTAAPGSCSDSNPLTGTFYYYPSFLDSGSTSNFNTINLGGTTSYVYMTQWINCPTNTRNLVRVPVTVTE